MSLLQTLCGILGHHWVKHVEPGTTRLVQCKRCGELTSIQEAARIERGRGWGPTGGMG